MNLYLLFSSLHLQTNISPCTIRELMLNAYHPSPNQETQMDICRTRDPKQLWQHDSLMRKSKIFIDSVIIVFRSIFNSFALWNFEFQCNEIALLSA